MPSLYIFFWVKGWNTKQGNLEAKPQTNNWNEREFCSLPLMRSCICSLRFQWIDTLFCWYLVAKNINYCLFWKIEFISLDDIGADGRIFGSGISFNNTSLSDIGDQISNWLSTHCWWQTSQELRMLSRSLSDCKSLFLKVMIQVSQFVSNSQLCH